ncbi:MAG TPA: M24 family metallopeptidase [Chloroflexota bacterium]
MAQAAVDAPLSFSLAERDHRWKALRDEMRADGIDILVATGNTGRYNHHTADARYITQIGGQDIDPHAILPLEGEVTAIARGPAEWVQDVREYSRSEGSGIVEVLKELAADGKRIAIAGLGDLIRAPDGIATYGIVHKIETAFPNAKIVNGTPLMYRVRSVKSDEEIAFIRKAVQIAEAAVRAFARTARPGVKDRSVYAQMIAAEIEEGGEMPVMLAWHASQAGTPYKRLTQATPTRVVEAGDIIYMQIEGKWQGYLAQMDQAFTIGAVPQLIRDMAAAQVEAFHATLPAMKVGNTFADMYEACAATAKGKPYQANLILHGRGLGEDWPLLVQPDPEILRQPLKENYVMDVKPGIVRDGRDLWGRFGDSVRVTRTGGERLGTRAAGLAAIDA